MSKCTPPVTAAIRMLRKHKVSFTDHLYDYENKGGTSQSAQALGVEEHCVIKTLILENDRKQPMIVLMHGDQQVSTKELARALGVKSITPSDPQIAHKHSGYQVGGISPFGTRKTMPVYMESSILELPRIYINGGKRGYLISINPAEAKRILQAALVQVGIRI